MMDRYACFYLSAHSIISASSVKIRAENQRRLEWYYLALTRQMAVAEGVTEQLKADNQMAWAGKMNSIRNRAAEIINTEIIYT